MRASHFGQRRGVRRLELRDRPLEGPRALNGAVVGVLQLAPHRDRSGLVSGARRIESCLQPRNLRLQRLVAQGKVLIRCSSGVHQVFIRAYQGSSGEIMGDQGRSHL